MNESESEPHVYIHVPPIKTGQKFVRLIIPVSRVKKFNYETFLTYPEQFKDRLFSFKDNEGEKRKGIIITSAENPTKLEKIVQNAKRFRVPKIQDSINVNENESSSDNFSSAVHKENVQRVRYEEKERKQVKRSNKRIACEDIINLYVNENTNKFDNDVLSDSSYNFNTYNNYIQKPTEKYALRRLQSNNTNDDVELQKVINALKIQTTCFKEKAELIELEASKWKKKYDELLNNMSVNSEATCTVCAQHKQDAETFAYLDKVYAYSNTSNTPEQINDDKVLLYNDIECNRKAYTDSIKAKEPIEVIKLLSIGIYGYEDLAKRCVRDQKNTQGQIVLDPKRIVAIERVFYRYLRMNGYPANLLKKELNKFGIYQHNAISCARSKIKRQSIVDETIENLQQAINETAPF